jgi:hypothetical protein
MARRSLLVAIAATVAALLPAAANAATAPNDFAANPATGTSGQVVTMTWNTAADVATQRVLRAPGACTAPPIATAIQIATPTPQPLGGLSAATDTPPDGTWCYYVEVNDLVPVTPAYSNTDSVVITPPVDTTPPVADPPGVTFTGAPNFARGAVAVSLNSTDAGSPPTVNSLRLGTDTCDAATPAIASPWDTTTVADGTYRLCNVATDASNNTAVSAAVVVIVDNTAPLGSILTPAAGAVVGGTTTLTTDAVDATAGLRTVRWQRSTTGVGGWGNGNIPGSNAGNGFAVNWNTATGNNHPADGPIFLRLVITDNAGNVLNTPAIAISVDNTNPDAAALLTAPPAVAGSPTLNWTPAHDAVGIDHYEIRRSSSAGAAGPVVGTRVNTGAATYSYADTTAPDQQTSYYTVRAFDAAGHFVDSNSASVLVDSKAQSAPQTLSAATPTASAPALSWQAPPIFNVDHYDVYRDGLLLASTTGPATTYVDATAIEGVHDYAVLARGPAAQPGVLSSSFKVLLDKTAPTSGGAPTAQVLAGNSVQLAWPAAGDSLSGVAGYVVRRVAGGTPPAAPDAGAAVCAPATTGCTDGAMAAGTWSYGVFARDGANNVALIGTVANIVLVDTEGPLAPTKLSVVKPKAKKAGTSINFTLHWVLPTALDLDRVIVVLNLKHAPATPADGKAVYKGLATSAKITLRAGQTGYLALYAYDHSGNASKTPARTVLRLASLIPLRPLNGSVVRSSRPMLTWKAKQGTTYYNVLVFSKGKRILAGWPSKAAYRIPAGKLKPGTYVWYVWPAVKGKSKTGTPSFGKLIGRATFTYKKK